MICHVRRGAYAQTYDEPYRAEDRSAASCQAVKSGDSREGEENTDQKPTVKTAAIPTFCLVLVCNFHTNLMGTRSIMRSVILLKRPLVFSRVGISIQRPGMDEFQILSLGLHSQILTNEVAM